MAYYMYTASEVFANHFHAIVVFQGLLINLITSIVMEPTRSNQTVDPFITFGISYQI